MVENKAGEKGSRAGKKVRISADDGYSEFGIVQYAPGSQEAAAVAEVTA